ncbi:ubiquitin ligase (cullin) of SCF [Coemansia brasiliensis]|uniref:Ubiquitin ligase (Cullin) of SCF n=1 Tax=Coemansia brasiliensis TaxID=2650707 RepID=A0A9W8LWJ5_9FUNG|nr:ubiquitin ligase (cullin) of SCF [Coemansia brasiliensis]
MGKSARSKSKIRNRNVRRATIFGPVEAERIQRLAAKQQVKSGNIGELMDTDEPAASSVSAATDDVEMSAPKASKSVKKGSKNKPKRIVIRNKKGRIFEFLDALERVLDALVVCRESMTYDEYMTVYSAIHTCQEAPGYEVLGLVMDTENRDIFKLVQRSRILYDWLASYIERVLSDIYNESAAIRGENLLNYYIEQWAHFQRSCSLLSSLFTSVDKQWIEYKHDRNFNYECIADRMVQLWYDCFFKRIASRLVSSAIAMVDSERSSTAINGLRVTKLYKSFMELKPLNMPDIKVNYHEDFGVYIHYYEMPYIAAAIHYIDEKTYSLRASNQMYKYIGMVHELFLKEEERAKQYLCSESLIALQVCLNNEFLIKCIKPTNELAVQIADTQCDVDKLQPSYSLLQQFEKHDVLEHLQNEFISRALRDIFQSCPYSPENSSVSMSGFSLNAITYLSDKYELGKAAIGMLFKENPTFEKAFDSMFKQLINSEDIRCRFKVDPARLAAEFCNLVLKSRSTTEGNFTHLLKKAMNVFQASSSKTTFFSFYSLHLSRRLLNSTSISMDFEKTAISMIYETALSLDNGGDLSIGGLAAVYFGKYRQMVSEISTRNEQLHDKFNESIGYEASVRVLSKEVWDFIKPDYDQNVVLPVQLSKACDQLAKYYSEQYSNRIIRWQWLYTTATVQVYFPNSKSRYAAAGYTFVLNAFQVAILSLFIDSLVASAVGYTLEQICNETNLSVERISMELDTMIRAKILICTATGIHLNQAFSSKHQRVDISHTKADVKRHEEKWLEYEVAKVHVEYIMADVVYLMKSLKIISHKELFAHVASRRGGYFMVTMHLFKVAIDKLIHKEYICRSSDDYSIYEYPT